MPRLEPVADPAPPKNDPVPPSVGNFWELLLSIPRTVLCLSENSRFVAPIVVTLTSVATKLVICRIAYTEIDFSTYMQQIELINDGELDYAAIRGDTGDLVYPAGFVKIYQWLHHLSNGGEDLGLVQGIFGYLLVITNLLVAIIYMSSVHIQPWPLFLLIASKRLLSIYVLRLFNDCFVTLCMAGVTLFLQQAATNYTYSPATSFLLTLVAADLFSVAISIKMNALLYLPGFVIVSFFCVGQSALKLMMVLMVIPLVQLLIGWQFLLPLFYDQDASHIRWNYLTRAFDFSRKFMYKWTVNWRFVGEQVFDSDVFARALLLVHVLLLLVFVFTRFLHPKVTGQPLTLLIKNAITSMFSATKVAVPSRITNEATAAHLVLMILSTTNVIGVLCARLLHYQFLSWYCWQLPYLLFMTGWGVVPGVLIWLVHELTWNVFPSTSWSSALLVTVLSCVLFGVWRNTECWFGPPFAPVKTKKKD